MSEQEPTKDALADLAVQAYTKSTTYFDNNFRARIEDAYRHHQGEHATGSKYNTSAYQYRSKLFRPKTRAACRANEAAAMAAFFSNPDAVSIEPQNEDDPTQVASADVTKAICNYRLTETIPWFLTCIGGYQDAQITGVVISYQDWRYKEREKKFKVKTTVQDEFGNVLDVVESESKEIEVVEDKPVIKLLPVENVRIDPAADWIDPVNSSPYLIILWPMYVKDVQARMAKGGEDQKSGEGKWKKLDDGEIESASRFVYDSTRQVREQQREDSTEQRGSGKLKEFDVLWVHENFIATEDGDIRFLTLGDKRLTDPVPTEERYPQGRPVVMGYNIIEAHKVYPDSSVTMTSDVQVEINHVANDRRDNVSLVINKRYKVKRGKNVDLRAILRNAAGSVVLVDDENDVTEMEFSDVTSSSYAEHDRLNAEFDSLRGSFGTESVASNRQLNETVGGMNMLRQGAAALTEYDIKTFSESWVEPVIKQLVTLIQHYETDETIMALAAQKARVWQRFGIDQVTDQLLKQNLTVAVNAGMGATDPMRKLQSFVMAADKVVDMALKHSQLPQPVLNMPEAFKEVFGRLGHKDGARFLAGNPEEDPQIQQMMAVMEQMQAAIQQLQAQLEDKDADRQVKLIDTKMREDGQNQRKQAEIEAQQRTELFKAAVALQNPVAGENKRSAARR